MSKEYPSLKEALKDLSKGAKSRPVLYGDPNSPLEIGKITDLNKWNNEILSQFEKPESSGSWTPLESPDEIALDLYLSEGESLSEVGYISNCPECLQEQIFYHKTDDYLCRNCRDNG